MKRILVLLLPVLVSLHTARAQMTARAENLTIEVHEGIELLSVIQLLGGHMDNNTNSPYRDDMKRYFLPYRCQPAVETMFQFKFKVYSDLVECGLAFDNFPDIRMHPLPDSCSWVKYIGRDALDRYLRQCMQFYKDTHFHDFYTAHRPMFDQWAQGLRDSIGEPVRIFDSLINVRMDHHWLICMDPLNDWGAHTIMPRNVNMLYQNYFIYQLGYFGDTDRLGRMTFAADMYNFAWHEGTHAFTDSILKEFTPSIDSLAYLMPNSGALRRQNIDDWGHYFNELIANAFSTALHKQFRSEKDYDKLLHVQEQAGFVHIEVVSDVIYRDFIHERRVSSIETLLPRIFATLRALPKSQISPGTGSPNSAH